MKYFTVSIFAICLLPGCVERQLTINTVPDGALVILNDEQIGETPVTVSFNWYGDYRVQIRKTGYQTLHTHRKLEAPWYDAFPFDLFYQVLSAPNTVDVYQWDFALEPQQPVSDTQLIDRAAELKNQVQ